VVISWTFAFTTGVLFECELPRPWAVFNGKCIPMVSLHAQTKEGVTDLLLL
jgi:hypothetical protein